MAALVGDDPKGLEVGVEVPKLNPLATCVAGVTPPNANGVAVGAGAGAAAGAENEKGAAGIDVGADDVTAVEAEGGFAEPKTNGLGLEAASEEVVDKGTLAKLNGDGDPTGATEVFTGLKLNTGEGCEVVGFATSLGTSGAGSSFTGSALADGVAGLVRLKAGADVPEPVEPLKPPKLNTFGAGASARGVCIGFPSTFCSKPIEGGGDGAADRSAGAGATGVSNVNLVSGALGAALSVSAVGGFPNPAKRLLEPPVLRTPGFEAAPKLNGKDFVAEESVFGGAPKLKTGAAAGVAVGAGAPNENGRDAMGPLAVFGAISAAGAGSGALGGAEKEKDGPPNV